MDIDKLIELRNKNYTIKSIAEYFNVSTSTIKRTIKRYGLLKENVTIDEKKFLDLYNNGVSDDEIASIFNVTKNKIVTYRKNLKLLSQTDRKRQENKKLFLELYNQGFNDTEISNKLNINHVTIKNWREDLNLPSNFKYTRSFNTNKFLELYNQGLNYEEIAKIIVVSTSAINDYALSLNLAPNTYNKLIPSYEEEQILLGTLYGDGWLGKQCKHPNGGFAHSLKQENYCKWKQEKLKRFVTSGTYRTEVDKRSKKEYASYSVTLAASEYFSNIYNKLYDDNRIKFIHSDLLNKLDGLGIAVWFMDDGYKEDFGYSISTNCFSLQDLELIKSFFKNKFNISVTIHKDHTIYIGAKSKDLFTNLIKPYIHSDCLYKLHVANKNSVKQKNPIE